MNRVGGWGVGGAPFCGVQGQRRMLQPLPQLLKAYCGAAGHELHAGHPTGRMAGGLQLSQRGAHAIPTH